MAPKLSKSHNAKKEGKAANSKTPQKVRFAADTKEDDTSSQVKAHGSTKITKDLEVELVPQELTREALQSQGWDVERIPSGFGENIVVADHCTLPSPLAEKPMQRQALLAIGSSYARINLSQSLSHINSVGDDFRTAFSSGDALLGDGSRARLLTVGKDRVPLKSKVNSFGWTEKSPPLKRIPMCVIVNPVAILLLISPGTRSALTARISTLARLLNFARSSIAIAAMAIS